MPYRTQHGNHYHETFGCHGATIPCGTEGLEPCSDCCDTHRMTSAFSQVTDGTPSSSIPSGLTIKWDLPDDEGQTASPEPDDGNNASPPTISATDLHSIDSLGLLDDIDIDSIIQAPQLTIGDDVTERLPTIMEVMGDIDRAIQGYGNMERRSRALRRVDIGNADNREVLASIIQTAMESALSSYGVSTARDGEWQRVLSEIAVVDTLDEWKSMRYKEIEEWGDLEDRLLLRDVACFQGGKIWLNKQGIQARDDSYAELKIILHENFHNMGFSSPTSATTGFHLTVEDGAESPTQWRNINEGMTEVLSNMVTESIVGPIPIAEWARHSGHMAGYVVCRAIANIIGIETILPAYMRNDVSSLTSCLSTSTNRELTIARVNTILTEYEDEQNKYLIQWIAHQYAVGDATGEDQRKLIDQCDTMRRKGEEIVELLRVCQRHSDNSPQAENLVTIFRNCQRDFVNRPLG